MAEPRSDFKVIIIGSGLSGSLLANGLSANGIKFTIYERLERYSKREGYQIRLGGPALIGMRACLTPDRLNSVVQKFGRAAGSILSAPTLYHKDFSKLIDLTRFSAYSKSAAINRVTLRDILAEPIFESGNLVYERAFSRYEIRDAGTATEQVRVWFEDGKWDECDVLIGADGSHSKVNKQLGLNNIKEISSTVTVLAKAELPTKSFLDMHQQLRAGPVMTFADKKAFFFAVYLPDKLDEHGERLKALNGDEPCFDDSVSSSMVGMLVPRETFPADLSTQTKEEKWAVVSAALRGWSNEFHKIIELVKEADPYIYTPRVSSRPQCNWRSKVAALGAPELGNPRVWIIGDAMHAMLPTRGMGGNQSMQDTATALPLLKKLNQERVSGHVIQTDDIFRACKMLEDEMIPRAFSWVHKSGGFNTTPLDSSTLTGKALIFIGSFVLFILSAWSKFISFNRQTRVVDDAPEFQG